MKVVIFAFIPVFHSYKCRSLFGAAVVIAVVVFRRERLCLPFCTTKCQEPRITQQTPSIHSKAIGMMGKQMKRLNHTARPPLSLTDECTGNKRTERVGAKRKTHACMYTSNQKRGGKEPISTHKHTHTHTYTLHRVFEPNTCEALLCNKPNNTKTREHHTHTNAQEPHGENKEKENT
jgi:hypothetical protein